MRKIYSLLSVSFFVLLHLTANAGKNNFNPDRETKSTPLLLKKAKDPEKSMIAGGFFLHTGIFLPSKNYLYPRAVNNDSDQRFGTGIDLDLGHTFLLTNIGPMGIGLRATWFSSGYSKNVADTSLKGTTRAFNVSAPRLGPYMTYQINDLMAMDVFYQVGPGFAMLFDRDWNNVSDGAFGLTHECGLGYRISKLSAGFGYRFGNVIDMNVKISDVDKGNRDFYRMRVNNFRIFLGFKI